MAKSRVSWLTQGDRNTAFYHRSVMIKRHKSAIRCLKDDCGNQVSNPNELHKLIQGFYVKLYTSEKVTSCRSLVGGGNISLAHVPSDCEIKSAIFAMKPLKSPGSDGFHPIFFQKEWHIVGPDICESIRKWFKDTNIPSDLGRPTFVLFLSRLTWRVSNISGLLAYATPCTNL